MNSAKNAYQVDVKALDLLRAFGTATWPRHLADYLAEPGTLARKCAQQRAMARIPVTLPVTPRAASAVTGPIPPPGSG